MISYPQISMEVEKMKDIRSIFKIKNEIMCRRMQDSRACSVAWGVSLPFDTP